MARKLILTGTTLTDLSAPKIPTIDPIESPGSIFLIEPMHPSAQWVAGIPADGNTRANILPILVPTLLTFTTSVKGGINNLTKGKMERTTKGGLHVILSQANAIASGDGAALLPPAALSTYLVANLANDYYFSAWDRVTRAALSPATAMDYVTYSSTTAGIFFSQAANWTIPAGAVNLGNRALGNVVGPRFGNIAVDRVVTGVQSLAFPEWGVPSGSYINASLLAANNLKWASFAFYRCYLEDLTVSGRTYAQVDALDYALYTKEVLTAGGRYYGDTFTAPSTIPWGGDMPVSAYGSGTYGSAVFGSPPDEREAAQYGPGVYGINTYVAQEVGIYDEGFYDSDVYADSFAEGIPTMHITRREIILYTRMRRPAPVLIATVR